MGTINQNAIDPPEVSNLAADYAKKLDRMNARLDSEVAKNIHGPPQTVKVTVPPPVKFKDHDERD